jgi:hypothetical protein
VFVYPSLTTLKSVDPLSLQEHLHVGGVRRRIVRAANGCDGGRVASARGFMHDIRGVYAAQMHDTCHGFGMTGGTIARGGTRLN